MNGILKAPPGLCSAVEDPRLRVTVIVGMEGLSLRLPDQNASVCH